MGKYASGKFAKRISDRSGMAFPYNEMVQEWNGSWVHYSEFEPKQPQLEPLPMVTDPQSLEHARAQVANSRVFIGQDGVTVNDFQTLNMSVTNFYANGVSYASTQKSMMPLSLQRPNKPTLLHSSTGNVTVSTS
jgi:hypothetical protein